MTSDRQTRYGTPPNRSPRARAGRAAALTAGAALGLGVLAVPFAGAGANGPAGAGPVALAADTVTPAVTLDARSAPPGGSVSFGAAGFPAGATLSVKWDDRTLLAQFPIGDDGTARGTVSVPADATAGGGHWLRFLAPGTSVRSDDVTVTADGPTTPPTTPPTTAPTTPPTTPPATPPTTPPTATAPPTTAPTTPPTTAPAVTLGTGSVTAGGRVTFGLSGFTAGQSVTVKLDDSAILGRWTAAVRADGTFSGTVTVPAGTPAGAHWLRVLAPNPPTSVRADFTVTPAGATSGAGTGGSGSTGGTGGTGGGSGGGGSSGATSGGNSSGGGGGSVAGGGTGTAGGTGSASGPSASITSATAVAAGSRVSFRVTGFPAGRQLTVKLDDDAILGQWPGGAGADGSLSGSVTVPADTPAGAHWLRFLAPGPPTSRRADFAVTSTAAGSTAAGASGGAAAGAGAAPGAAPGAIPAASGAPATASNSAGAKAQITASRVQPGGKIHFKVTGFPASRTVTVKLDDDAILGQWTADARGAYEGDVTIPAATATGAHWLRFLAPDPPTTLKVDITVTAPSAAPAADAGSPAPAPAATGPSDWAGGTATVAARSDSLSYATIAWSAAAAAAGGAAGAAGTCVLVLRRRKPQPAAGN